MANLADSKWGQQMDKLAYGIGGLLAVVILASAVVLSGQDKGILLESAVKDINDAAKETDSEIRKTIEPPPNLRAVLERQWEAGTALSFDPKWTTERAPALIKVIEKVELPEPKHLAGMLDAVICERDPEKRTPVLVLKGHLSPENNLIAITKLEILRKTGEEPDFKVLGDLAAAGRVDPVGTFEYRDPEVQAGQTYSYQIRTTAREATRGENAEKLAESDKVQESDVLGPTEAVPYDYALTISSIPKLTDPTVAPTFYGRFVYWDYATGEVVEFKGGQLQIFKEKQKIGEKVGTAVRYEFLRIDDTEQEVTVKDYLRRGLDSREDFAVRDAKTMRPVACWSQPLTAAPAGGTAEAAPEGTAEGTMPAEEPGAGAEAPSVETPPATEVETSPAEEAAAEESEPEPESTSDPSSEGSRTRRRTFR